MRNLSYDLAAICLAGALGAADSAFNDLYRPSGISHTGGAMLAIVSCLLIVGASIWAAALRPGWLRATLVVLLLLGLIGTGLAAYFLEAYVLLVLMAVGLLAWCADRFPDREPRRQALLQ